MLNNEKQNNTYYSKYHQNKKCGCARAQTHINYIFIYLYYLEIHTILQQNILLFSSLRTNNTIYSIYTFIIIIIW